MKKILVTATAVAAVLLSPGKAQAWDGVVSGTISTLDVTDGENYGFRVSLQGAPMCGSSATWGYINKSFDNYDAMVSTLTSAFLAGKTVTLFSYVDPQGYCKIGYIRLSN